MLTKKKRYFILFNFIIWLFLGIIFFVGMMPETPLNINKNLKKQLSMVFPNRWVFFTKDPTEDYIYILRKTKQGYGFYENFPNSSLSNVFGMISYQKAAGLEYGIIANQIDDNLWSNNNGGRTFLQLLKEENTKILELKRTDQITSLSGEFVFVKIEPVPYVWRNKIDRFAMPSKFVRIKIK